MKYILALLGLILTGLIFWAFSVKPITESFSLIVDDPWGMVTLADLYLGFFVYSVFIFATSKSKIQALLWAISVFVLGNVVSVIHLIIFLSKKENKKRGKL